MGLQIRDDRQIKALTGLSQAQFDHLLSVFRNIYWATQQKTYEEGVESGTRRRRPGGGSKGKVPTMAEKLPFVLYYYKTYPTFDVLGTQFEMARSKAHENLHKLSPILYDTLVSLELMPYREFTPPEALQAALQGGDRLLIDATERAYHRSQDAAKQREPYSGKKTAYVEKYGHVVWSKNSCGFARVVFQEPSEPFTTLHQALTLCVVADRRKEQHVVLALMIALVMKMLHVLRQRMAERRFPKQDEPR